MLIREANDADLDAIFAIYEREVLTGTATFDTETKSPAQRAEWLATHRSPRTPAIVAEVHGGVIAGWASLSPWSNRCAYARAAENSVYVHADHRGKGVGGALLDDLIARARRTGLGVILARVVEGNPASVTLHESRGFQTIGIMRRVGEKFGRILDVRLMDLHLDAAT
ncbi:MAG: N-acetyltransferase [Phycisphaerales bacterium]|nr:N-acetyltransferase [Phycisphaerales bacterium]